MESMRLVIEKKDGLKEYDNLVFLNCGLVGPKHGSHSPISTHSHWTQLFTLPLTDSIRMTGLTINPTNSPHIQSFLYAMSTETLPILLSAGNIYDCGGGRTGFQLIDRYEIGMSRTLLGKGYSIAVPYMNNLEMGKSLIVDRNSFHKVKSGSDLWFEDTLRNATLTMDKSELQKLVGYDGEDSSTDRSILPWEYYVFFKVSRFVPEDIQREMEYDTDLLEKHKVLIVPNKCC
jgi:hypothetical protein